MKLCMSTPQFVHVVRYYGLYWLVFSGAHVPRSCIPLATCSGVRVSTPLLVLSGMIIASGFPAIDWLCESRDTVGALLTYPLPLRLSEKW